MATSMQMLKIGIIWAVAMVTLGYMAYVGGLWMKAINDFAMQYFHFNPYWAGQIGISWWWEPLYYTVIVLVAMAATYRCYQEIVIDTMYYPEQGFF